MQLPHPMVEYKLDNEYNIMMFASSSLRDWFEKDYWLLAAKCIWWVVSIIQFTEILINYRHYKLFPSEVIRDCYVTPLPQTASKKMAIPESDIRLFDIGHDSDCEGYLSQATILPRNRPSKLSSTTHSGNLSKNYREAMNLQLQARFGWLTKYQ